jgi:hypothetical protein
MEFAPPTDSLYKFSAIVGTILVVLSIYLPMKMSRDVRREILNSNLKIRVFEVEVEHLKKRADDLKKLIDHTVAMRKKSYKPDNSKIDLTYSEEEVKQMLREITNSQRDIGIKRAEIESAAQRIKVLEREYLVTWVYLLVGCVIGAYLALWGYVNWYRRIQVHQDKIIKDLSTKGEQNESGSDQNQR